MKPIHLSLAGLQSYREKQEIDFTRLCDAGVFGIFGSTGSGKSTILDAMTLALYGKVERAPNGTQGIINQHEQALSVSFTFELNGAQGAVRYRIDRQYKRGKDQSIQQTVARMLRQGPGEAEPVVVAEKAQEVNEKVVEVLGLSMHDFTRAVVLPQGKFAEFLTLKGAERRQMLQRLFHLESYGDLLGLKVNQRARETDNAIKRLEAEQQGLGDASAEAVEAARTRLGQARDEAEAHRAKLAEAEQEAEALKRLYQLTMELDRLEQEYEAGLGKGPEIETIRSRLAQAEQAARIAPYWEERINAAQQADDRSREYEEAELQHQHALGKWQSLKRLAEEARAAWEKESGPLTVKLERLKAALELAREIEADSARERELAAKASQAAAEVEKLAAACTTEQAKLEKARMLQAQLKAELQAKEIPPERKRIIQAAYADHQRLETAFRQADDAGEEWEKIQLPLKQAEEQVALLQKRLEQAAIRLASGIEEGIMFREALRQANDELLGLMEQVRSRIEQEREAAREDLRRTLAAQLAHSLADGQPCPVCGSTHHPAPASAMQAGSPEAREQVAEDLEILLRQLEDRMAYGREALLAATRQLELLRQALDSVTEAIGQALPEAAVGVAMPDAVNRNVLDQERERNGMVQDIRQARESVQQVINCQTNRIERIEQWIKQSQLQADALRDAGRVLSDATAEWTATKQLAASHEAKLDKARAEATRLKAWWNRTYPDLPLEKVTAEWETFLLLDREADTLRRRLENSEPYLEEQQRVIRQLELERSDADKQLAEIRAEWRSLGEQLAKKRERLVQQAGEAAPNLERHIREVESRLETLQKTAVETARESEQWHEEVQRLSNRLAAAKQGLEAARGMLARAEDNWRKALAGTSFASAEDMLAARLDARTVAALEEEVRHYQETMAVLKERLDRTRHELQNRRVGEQEWQQCLERLESAKRLNESLLAACAKAERDLEELEAKHERWTRIEREKAELAALYARLAKLQSVLRGNAFVEYVAEEQLMQVSRAASERLGQLTHRRYALEVDSTGGFVIRDDANGGLRRPVTTLSGGETFLTSLSLALALSAQIQLNGRYPLEFFFLDEGFGTLDSELLETVMTALEKLHMEKLTVGVISHVPELKARLPRRLVVLPAEPFGRGSQIRLETL